MSTARRGASQARPAFRVGDRVRFQRVFDEIEGVVVEDRGLIGVGGRRLYRIQYDLDYSPGLAIELPAEDLKRVD